MTTMTGTDKQVAYAADLYAGASGGYKMVADMIATITDSAAVQIAFLKDDGFEYTIRRTCGDQAVADLAAAHKTEHVKWPIVDAIYLVRLAQAIDAAIASVARTKELLITYADTASRVDRYTQILAKAETRLSDLTR